MKLIDPDRAAWKQALLYVTRDVVLGHNRDPVAAMIEAIMDDFPWARRHGMLNLVEDHLGDLPWEWPWLLEWKVKFRALGAFPRIWTQPQLIAAGRTRARHTEFVSDAFLLAHTIMTTRRLFIKHAGEKYVRFYTPTTDNPPAIQQLEVASVISYQNGIKRLLPPYWPGHLINWSMTNSTKSTGIITPYNGGLMPW